MQTARSPSSILQTAQAHDVNEANKYVTKLQGHEFASKALKSGQPMHVADLEPAAYDIPDTSWALPIIGVRLQDKLIFLFRYH